MTSAESQAPAAYPEPSRTGDQASQARGSTRQRPVAAPRAMHIAFFVAEFPVLSETFVIRQVAGMLRAGHRVTVITGQAGDPAIAHEIFREIEGEGCIRPIRGDRHGALQRAGVIGRFLLGALVSRQGWRQLAVALEGVRDGSLASLLDIAAQSSRGSLGRFDAVIAHFGPSGVRAMNLQRAGLLDGRIATVFHGLDMSDHATIRRHLGSYRKLFERTALALPISQLWKARLEGWGARPEQVRVLRMGVDLDRLQMLPTDRPLHSPLRILSVARFTEKKGLRYAIEGVCGAQLPIEYDIIGAGPLEDELKALAAQAGPQTRIRFLGKRSQQEVFAALERADVFLLPSVTAAGGDMEGIPVALMEAMAKGVLVLATRHSGIPELIDHERSGLLVPERCADSISEALAYWIMHPDAVAAMRCSARQKIASDFDNAALDWQLAHLCASMAGAASGGGPNLDPASERFGAKA